MKTVLIVDDSRTTRNYHATIISSAGYQVITATDGADGLEKLLMGVCDLVLTDINMEGIDGYDFIRQIRTSEGHEDVPVIVISTEGQAKDQAKGYAAGANLYLVKPTQPENLVGYVKMMLGDPQ